MVKTAEDNTISAGEVAEFSIVITNIGLGTAYDVSLTDTLPGGVTWILDEVAYDGVPVADPDALCTISGISLSCPDLGDLAPDGEITITISGDTDLDDCGPLVNSVTSARRTRIDAGPGQQHRQRDRRRRLPRTGHRQGRRPHRSGAHRQPDRLHGHDPEQR